MGRPAQLCNALALDPVLNFMPLWNVV
jgi:hypothetical protein